LLLSTENGLRRWQTDLNRMYTTLSEREQQLVNQHLRILAITPDEDADLNLGNPDAVARIAHTLRTEKPGCIVFDPFADMVAGDENTTADIIATLRLLKKVHRENASQAAVIIIHHARTGAANVLQAGDGFSVGNFGRGSKALYSRVRCELQLAPADRDDPNRLLLACGKANNSERFEPRGIKFDPETFTYSVDDEFDLEAWRADVSGKRRQTTVTIADVVDIVQSSPTGGNVTTAEIVQPLTLRLGVSGKTVQRRIGDAKKFGYLIDGTKRGTWRLGEKRIQL
jgi:hypothetical protein